MAKWLVAIGALAVALVVLLWQLSAPPKPRSVLAHSSSSDETEPSEGSSNRQADTQGSSATAPRNNVDTPEPDPEEPEIEMLVPGTPEFGHRMDVVVPENFREALAPCYKGGLDGNLKLTITYQLHIVSGKIYATDVKVAKSEINDQALEQCMVTAVQQLSWTADDVPDWSEEQELFVRLRTLKKYESRRKMFEEDDYDLDDDVD